METYNGHVRTPADAIILFEACRLGLLPRVQRRLSEKERQSIKSGSVFVWDEREAGMRRWTDGKSWSASRVSGSFLTYREMEGKRGGAHSSQTSSRAGKTPDSNRGSDEDAGENGEEGPDGYRYKPDGLMKQSFSITTSTGQHLHLISYYARSHPTAAGLNQPSTDPALRHIRPQKDLYPESTVNDQQNLPAVTRGPMAGAPPYALSPQTLGAYPRSGVTLPPSYVPAPYNWAPAMNGATHIPLIPYYLPPLSNVHGQPAFAYSHLPHLTPPHGHLPPPYDRPAYTPDPKLPPPSQPAHPGMMPFYTPGRSPALSQSSPYEPPRRDSPGHHPLHSLPPIAQSDPRSTPTKSEHGQYEVNGVYNRIPSPAPLKDIPPVQQGSANGVENGATTVPSINSLMNGPPAASISTPPSNVADRPPSTDNPANGSRTQSPTTLKTNDEGPKDIPSEKIGFGEDVRALRQLDRVFTA